MAKLSAEDFLESLGALRTDTIAPLTDESLKSVKMGDIFKLGKEYSAMPVEEIENLMKSGVHKVRVGALSIMGQCAKGKKCTADRLQELAELYLRRHDLINDWGLVDLAAYYVVGQYLADKPRDILYRLAKSDNRWERRTAIVATAHFILKLKQTADTYAIAEMLVHDPEDTVNKGTGWMVRAAGDIDRPGLYDFLDKYAATMPRVLLRYSIEKLPPAERTHYLGLKATAK